MATLETQAVDELIATTRRKVMTLGGAALAGIAFAGNSRQAAAQAAAYTDFDILNFALNLEYLEANFYTLAVFGQTIDMPLTKTQVNAGAQQAAITGTGTQGVVLYKPNPTVPFKTVQAASYALEITMHEVQHVIDLRAFISNAAGPIAQPQIDLSQASWNALATAATIPTPFDPFASDANFLLASYVFEDVGVTAYHGAAPLITDKKNVLYAAAGILAVEAYHSGLLRTAINALDPDGALGLIGLTQKISKLRSNLSSAAFTASGGKGFPAGPLGDDIPLQSTLAPANVMLQGNAAVATSIVNADANVIAFSRNTTQVINIVTSGAAAPAGVVVSPAKGGFFPNGLNGLFV